MFSKLLLITLGLSFFLYNVHAVDQALVNPNDGQIINILVATNEGEVNLAKLAKSNAENSEIKDFASTMISDHSGNIKKIIAVAKKNNISPEDNIKSSEIKQEGSQDIKMLKELKGRNFDLSYINNQVTAHQKVLQTLETLLIPSAKNKDILELLGKTRADVAGHLDKAVQIQTKLAAEIAK